MASLVLGQVGLFPLLREVRFWAREPQAGRRPNRFASGPPRANECTPNWSRAHPDLDATQRKDTDALADSAIPTWRDAPSNLLGRHHGSQSTAPVNDLRRRTGPDHQTKIQVSDSTAERNTASHL
ncbi:hypothetical protein GCM10018952_05890 [Streptosporangium vulgare]